ncbi:MAG TPA: amidohydrolase family protein [Dermatophilaceae bacterium]|nr:amidohydrolase family protein [Dermatophilaceae bacterium]
MTLVRGFLADVPDDPFRGGALRTETDGGLVVLGGEIVARGGFAALQRDWPDEPVLDLRGGVVVPGFVDTHVHFPQVRIAGGLGIPLLEWLDQLALPEEARLADAAYARAVAGELIDGLLRAGTTSALVFGSHFPAAVDELFATADGAGFRLTAGVVVSDLALREDLLVTPEQARTGSLAVAGRWHGQGRFAGQGKAAAGQDRAQGQLAGQGQLPGHGRSRLRYAVTPRFSHSCTEAMLEVCGDVAAAVPGAFVTSHVNENDAEIRAVTERFGTSYVETYERHRLLSPRTVLAHNVHPSDAELARLAERDTAIAHCPSSNSGLGSGSFPLRRHLDHGIRVALGTDVAGGTSLSLLREGLQAFFVQQLLGERGVRLGPAELLWLATGAGAAALDLPEVGALSVGRRFDSVWLRPAPGSPLEVPWRHTESEADAIARLFTLATPADIAGVWIDGVQVHPAG